MNGGPAVALRAEASFILDFLLLFDHAKSKRKFTLKKEKPTFPEGIKLKGIFAEILHYLEYNLQ